MTPKPDKGITEKENFRPISLNNTDAEMFNRMLAHLVQQPRRGVMTKQALSCECGVGLMLEN